MAGLGLGTGISSATSGITPTSTTPVDPSIGILGLLLTQDGKNLLTQDEKFIAAQELQQFINTQAGDILSTQSGNQIVTS